MRHKMEVLVIKKFRTEKAQYKDQKKVEIHFGITCTKILPMKKEKKEDRNNAKSST